MKPLARLMALVAFAALVDCGSTASVSNQMPTGSGLQSANPQGAFARLAPGQQDDAPSGPAFMSREARNATELLYAGHGNEVLIFPQDGPHRTKPIGRITDGIAHAWGMSVDSAGTLYVANYVQSGSVTIYPEGSVHPSLTLTAGLIFPTSAVVGPDGTVYACDSTGQVEEFPAGQTAPSLVIPAISSTLGNLVPTDATLDANNSLYVAYVDPNESGGDYGYGIVYLYQPGSTNPIFTHVMPNWVGDLQFDTAGHLVLAAPLIANPPSGLLVYHLKPGKLLRHFGDNVDAWALRFAAGGKRVYVGDPQQHMIFAYGYPSGALEYTIGKPIGSITGLAVSPPKRY